MADKTQGQAQTSASQVSIKQVNNCLYNGNHKKQDSGNIPQGLHKVADLAQYGDKIPQGLPDNASAVFISNNNIIAYITSAGLTINKQAQAHLTDIQAGAVAFLQAQAESAGKAVAYTDIDWQGKSGKSGDMAQVLASKVGALFN